jgi:hypothetical protein
LLFRTIFRITGGFQKNFRFIGGFLKRAIGRIFTISSDFMEASRALFWIFFTKRQTKTVKNTSAHIKIAVLIFVHLMSLSL